MSITIGIAATFMFHSFSVLKQDRGTYLFFRSPVLPYGQLERRSPLFGYLFFLSFFLFFNFFFFLAITKFCRLPEIKWSVCISKSHLYVSFSGWGEYHLFIWSNLNFLFTFLTHSCLVLYSFCTNLLHSLIKWLIVLSLIWLIQFI